LTTEYEKLNKNISKEETEMAVNLEKEMTLEEKLMKAGLYQAVAILRMHERNEAKKRKASTLKMIKR